MTTMDFVPASHRTRNRNGLPHIANFRAWVYAWRDLLILGFFVLVIISSIVSLYRENNALKRDLDGAQTQVAALTARLEWFTEVAAVADALDQAEAARAQREKR